MTFKSFRVGGQYLLGASFSDGRVALVDQSLTRLLACFDLPANCRDGFDLSRDGQYLATGYIYVMPSHIELREVASGRIVASIPKTYASDVGLPANDRYVVYWSAVGKSGTWVYDRVSSQAVKIKRASAPTPGAWTHDRKALLLPVGTQRGGKAGFRVTFDPISVSSQLFPARHAVWVLDTNPLGDTFVILESDYTISCLRIADSSIVWRSQVPEVGWIAYTGDGRFLGMEQYDDPNGGVVRLVVLDACTGEIVRRIEQPEHGRYPFSGPRLLCVSGRIANLETGEVERGASDANWWRTVLREREDTSEH